jgi:hypothetical protein
VIETMLVIAAVSATGVGYKIWLIIFEDGATSWVLCATRDAVALISASPPTKRSALYVGCLPFKALHASAYRYQPSKAINLDLG